MTLNLTHSLELEERLRQEAERRGVSVDEIAVEFLDKHLPHNDLAVPGSNRCHDAFLSSYVSGDEGLYDDLGR